MHQKDIQEAEEFIRKNNTDVISALIQLGKTEEKKIKLQEAQAKLISEKFNVPQISTGDMLREAVKEKSTLGLQASKIMTAGKLVPDEIILELIK